MWALALGSSGLALAFKSALLSADAFPLNADEAIVALMARHILGGARPLFFYGQAYMGSLDAALMAAGFAIFGPHVLIIRCLQAGLYAGSVAATVFLARRILGSNRAALAAGLLMALPVVNVTLYTTVSLGGYGEALLIGLGLLLLGLRIHDRPTSAWAYLAWGFLAGLGFWGFPLVLVFALPALGLFGQAGFVRLPRRMWLLRMLGLAGAACLGAAPWLVHATRGGMGPAIAELGGSAIAGAGPESPVVGLANHALNLVVFGPTVVLGLRPPWDVTLLARPLLPVAVGFWVLSLAHVVFVVRRPGGGGPGRLLLLGVTSTLLLGYLLTPFGADPSGRYFLPLAAPLAVAGADMIDGLWSERRAVWLVALLAGVLSFNVWGTLEAARRDPPGLTTQYDAVTWIDHGYDLELMAFLRANGESRGYTNYWVAFPLAFLSEEELIYAPHLPYHLDFRYTARDRRYPPYESLVASSPRVAYITTFHPELDQRLREALDARAVAYREAWIGDYHVFYALSRPIRPGEMNLEPTATDASDGASAP